MNIAIIFFAKQDHSPLRHTIYQIHQHIVRLVRSMGTCFLQKDIQCHSGRLSALGGLAVMTRAWNVRDQGSIPH